MTVLWLIARPEGTTWLGTSSWLGDKLAASSSQPQLWIQIVFVFFLFIANFAILMGPMLIDGNLTQIRGYEPGDAEWGVKLADVRGQAEAKEEVRRVVALWQSGEAFEQAGGKRERGLLFLGAPGTGKTMLAKAIATGFNSPFVSIPGSGFAPTFIGIDAIIVRYLARKAKRLARKWGGQCIVFIDEIDAVGMRRAGARPGVPAAAAASRRTTRTTPLLRPERRAEPERRPDPRDARLARAAVRRARAAAVRAVWISAAHRRHRQPMFPGDGRRRRRAGAQPAARRHGRHRQPALRQRVFTNRINTFLDATYIVPRRIGKRLAAPAAAAAAPGADLLHRRDQRADRPARPGAHPAGPHGPPRLVPDADEAGPLDIFDLYLDKVAHEPDLDTPQRRDELARITNGYSPAMIEQVCSMALTIAHHDGRDAFGWDDIVEAMTTVESGTAVGVEYVPEETRAVAIHEAGHAVAAHVYMKGAESTRISIRMRAGSLGHHQALREGGALQLAGATRRWRALVWGLGAMAAEHVFYGENSTGVGGDVYSATAQAALDGRRLGDGPRADRAERRPRRRERGRGAQEDHEALRADRPADHEPHEPGGAQRRTRSPRVLSDPHKRALAAQILGQAYVQRVQPHPAQPGGRRDDRRHARRRARSSTATSSSSSSRARSSRPPRSTCCNESSWPTI